MWTSAEEITETSEREAVSKISKSSLASVQRMQERSNVSAFIFFGS